MSDNSEWAERRAREIRIGNGFWKYGPFPDQPGGTEAFRYDCMRCDWKLITVAAYDLTAENLEILEDHKENCKSQKGK